jgi:hypothetical protein
LALNCQGRCIALGLYARAHADENGLSQPLPVERLIAPMLERFIAGDRGFARARNGKAGGG